MRINALTLHDFRNYEEYRIDKMGDLVVFIGPNAVGKTNLLEAIHLLTTGTSFRHPQIAQLVREGRSGARIALNMGDGNRSIDVALALSQGKKKFEVNGKPKATADVKGMLPAVVFTPDDLDLAKKSSSIKRDALDALGTQLSKSYYVVHRDYEKALRYKNKLLKDEAPAALVDAMDETLVTCAAQLFCYRYSLFTRMVPLVNRYYSDISSAGEHLGATYQPSWDYLASVSATDDVHFAVKNNGSPDREVIRDLLYRSLRQNREAEQARHRSLVGPHNDKIAFYLSGKDASQFASQGQQRSIVLAWKLAEVAMIEQTIGTSPVLLLDDVMSELDTTRRDMLVQHVTTGIQTFITATDLSPFNEQLLEKAQVIELNRLERQD